MKRYSQNNEQDIILAHFGADVGTFLDLGCNDGVTLSNTRALALLGWSGVLVDASPTVAARAEQLYKDRPEIEVHNAGICEGNGPSILHESGPHIGREDLALLSSVKIEETEKWKKAGTVFKPVEFECVTFHELLKRTRFKTFDFITIDIEGNDLIALEQIDLTAVGCRMLIVEVNDRDITPYVDYCAGYGMRAITRTPENLILIR